MPKLYAGDGPPPSSKAKAVAPVERPAPTRKTAPPPHRHRTNRAVKPLTVRQQRLDQKYGEAYQARTGQSLSGEAGLLRALIEENIAPASQLMDVANVSAAPPDRRAPNQSLLNLATKPTPKPPHGKAASAAPQRLLARHGGSGLRFDVGDALSSWRDLLTGGGTGDVQSTASAQSAAQAKARYALAHPGLVQEPGATADPVAEAIIGGGIGGLGAASIRALAAPAAERAGAGFLAPAAEQAGTRLMVPTKGPLRHLFETRPSPATALADFSRQSAAHRIAAGSGILASSGGAQKVSETGHALGTAIRGGAPTILVDPSTLNPVGQALAAGKTPTAQQKADIELQHGPGRIGLTPQRRAQLMRQAHANGWLLPASVSDFELIPKAYKRNGSTGQHLLAGFVENAGDYAFVPAFAGAAYDATQRAAGGEGATPFVDLAQQTADATINALKHPIDNPIFAGAILKGGIHAAGKGSAKALGVKEQPLAFHYGTIGGKPDMRPYGIASANTLTRPAALLGQKLLNSPIAARRRVDSRGQLRPSIQDRILTKQAGGAGQLIGVRAQAAGAIATRDLVKAIRKLTLKEQILAVHSHVTGSPARNAARSYASELAQLEQRKAAGQTVDETALRALRAKSVEWDQLAQLEANLPAKTRQRINDFKVEANKIEVANQGHLAGWGLSPEEMNSRLWQQALQQHPTLEGQLQGITQTARGDLRAHRVEARRLMKESETRAAGLYRNADKWQRQADALKGRPLRTKVQTPGAPTPPTHPELDKIAAAAAKNADRRSVHNGAYFMTKAGELGVVVQSILGGKDPTLKGPKGRSLLQVKVMGSDGKIVVRRMTGAEFAGAKARYRAQSAAPRPKLGKAEKRPLTFGATDMAHAGQSAAIYPITTTAHTADGPVRIGVAKVTEEPSSAKGAPGRRVGFTESWRVVVGDSQAIPRTFSTRTEAAVYAEHLDAALARGDSPKAALAHADNPHRNPAAPTETALRALPPSKRKTALQKRAEETRVLADQVQAAANQHAERLAALKKGHASLLEQRIAPQHAAATAAAKADLAAQGFEPQMYVPQTPLDAGPSTFLAAQSPFLTHGRDRLPASRLKPNTGLTLRKGLVDESPSLALRAASKPAAIAQASMDIKRFLRENATPLDVSHKGMAVDQSKYAFIRVTKDGELDRPAIQQRLQQQAELLDRAGLGNKDANEGLLEAVFATTDGDHIPAGHYYVLPRVMRDKFLTDARTEVIRRSLAPGLRSISQKTTSGMINVYPRTIVNNAGGVAMSAMGGAGIGAHARILRDPRAKNLLEQAAPEMIHRGISGAQTRGISVQEGMKATLPLRWWTQWMRDKNVRTEDFVRGALAVNDLLKQAKEVQFGGKFRAALHRVNQETYDIAHGLRDTHPERYKRAIQHTIDWVGDFGHLSKLDPAAQLLMPFWRWTSHILKATLVTMPKSYPLRASLLMAMGEVGREYQRDHGIWPSWISGALDVGDHIPGFSAATEGITNVLNTSGAWPYATQEQIVAPGFDNAGVNATTGLGSLSPTIPFLAAIGGKDLGQFGPIMDPNHQPIQVGSGDWARALGQKALGIFPTPYSFSGQEPTSLPWDQRFKNNGLPRRENSPAAILGRALGVSASPVLTGGPDLTKQGQKSFTRAFSSFTALTPQQRAAMRRGWQAEPNGTITGQVPIP